MMPNLREPVANSPYDPEPVTSHQIREHHLTTGPNVAGSVASGVRREHRKISASRKSL